VLEFALSMQVFFPLACGHINSLFALGKTQELSQELTPGDDCCNARDISDFLKWITFSEFFCKK